MLYSQRNFSSKLPEHITFIVLFCTLAMSWYLGHSELKQSQEEIIKNQKTVAWLLNETTDDIPVKLSTNIFALSSRTQLKIQRVMKQARENFSCPIYLISTTGQLILTDSYGGPLGTREGQLLQYIPEMTAAIEQLISGKNQALYTNNDGVHQLKVLTSKINNILVVGDSRVLNWFSLSASPVYLLLTWGIILAGILRYIARRSVHKWRKQSLAQTIIDPLTTLPNRKGFNLLSTAFYRDSKENLTSLSLMLINLENFTRLNLTYGTEVGDVILNQVASYLRNQVRAPNLVCRWDGDEFIVLLKNHDVHSTCHLAKYIHDYILQHKFNLSGEAIGLKLRIGIHIPNNHCELHSLVSGAIFALNLAREKDRSCILYPAGNSPW